MNNLGAIPLPVVLVGLPGAGKSRVGKRLAEMLRVPHLDTDQLVEEAAGTTISDIFAAEGEAKFRVRELAALRHAIGQKAVISIGGGAVETTEVLQLLENVPVVHIEAELDVLYDRVKRHGGRPLLRENAEKTLTALDARRSPLYRQVASVTVWSTDGPLEGVVAQIIERFNVPKIITVRGIDPYPVAIGTNVLPWAFEQIPPDTQKILLVRPAELAPFGEVLRSAFESRGLDVTDFVHPDGESAKTLEVTERGWDLLGATQFGRRDLVVTLGGGATTDLGGFIAATWMRGIRVMHFPSTLLAMVDAAVGGKTGINAAAGKNLIGSFHNPIATAVSLDYLRTLPTVEYTSGLAEVIKCGFIADPEILRLVNENPQISQAGWALGEGIDVLEDLVTRAVRVKAHVVAEDFREGNLRETLNYGHTLAHAIEKDSDYRVRHGEAVAVGCVFAAELAAVKGMLTSAQVEQHRKIFASVGLPVTYAGDAHQLVELLYTDKKTRGDQLRFVMLEGIGKAATYPVSKELALEVATTRGIIR